MGTRSFIDFNSLTSQTSAPPDPCSGGKQTVGSPRDGILHSLDKGAGAGPRDDGDAP